MEHEAEQNNVQRSDRRRMTSMGMIAGNAEIDNETRLNFLISVTLCKYKTNNGQSHLAL